MFLFSISEMRNVGGHQCIDDLDQALTLFDLRQDPKEDEWAGHMINRASKDWSEMRMRLLQPDKPSSRKSGAEPSKIYLQKNGFVLFRDRGYHNFHIVLMEIRVGPALDFFFFGGFFFLALGA